MTILVTGGAGYIGSHLVHRLCEQGRQVVVVDNLSTGHEKAIHPKALFIRFDLEDRLYVGDVIRLYDIHTIYHFASRALVGESVKRPYTYLRDNTLNAINLIELAATSQSVKKFIFSSTCNVYGRHSDHRIGEHVPINPASPYGESKHFVERVLHWAAELSGLRCAILRYFNAAGAHPNGHIGEDHKPETHLIPTVLQVALGIRSHVNIYGTNHATHDGTCVRDYVHVEDLVDAHILAEEGLNERECLTYNLGNGRGYSVLEVVKAAEKITGRKIPLLPQEARVGDPDYLVADSSAIRRELGWKPKYDFEQIIETAWTWHLRHPYGYNLPGA